MVLQCHTEIIITFIPYSQMSDLEQKIARMISENYQGNHTTAGGKRIKTNSESKPFQNPQPTPSNPIDGKLVKQVIERWLMVMSSKRMEFRVIFLPRNFRQKLLQPLMINLPNKKSLSHELGAKKPNLASADQKFYNKAYDLLATVSSRFDFQ